MNSQELQRFAPTQHNGHKQPIAISALVSQLVMRREEFADG